MSIKPLTYTLVIGGRTLYVWKDDGSIYRWFVEMRARTHSRGKHPPEVVPWLGGVVEGHAWEARDWTSIDKTTGPRMVSANGR